MTPKSTPQVLKTATPSTSGIPRSKLKVSEQYRLSEWLSETRPRKSPYYPQMGDEIVYFIQGHQLYLDAVQLKHIYEISAKDLPWNKMPIRVSKIIDLSIFSVSLIEQALSVDIFSLKCVVDEFEIVSGPRVRQSDRHPV